MASYGPVERAARAELRALHQSVQSSASAAALVALARHLDRAKGAASAAVAAREVRLAASALHAGRDAVDAELRELFDELGRT